MKVGDIVTRLLAGEVEMKMRITYIDDKLLKCGPWTFNLETGLEIDEDLRWDGVTRSGSYLKEIKE